MGITIVFPRPVGIVHRLGISPLENEEYKLDCQGNGLYPVILKYSFSNSSTSITKDWLVSL